MNNIYIFGISNSMSVSMGNQNTEAQKLKPRVSSLRIMIKLLLKLE